MRVLGFLFFAFLVVFSLSAQRHTGEDLTVKVAILGSGDEVYSWFGHNALIIENAYSGESRFYNYGLFSFESENFFSDFLFGRMWYSSGAFSTESGIADYISQNRDVVLYTLDLPPEKREEVWEFAETSILPENREYLYHIFRDNCSTRIRDIIDIASGGQFREQLGGKQGRLTFRQHARCHLWFSFFWDWTLNFLMGQGVDLPITVWEEMYIPLEVANQIVKFNYIDGHGVTHKLVSNVETVYKSHNRLPVLDTPRAQWPITLTIGLVISSFIGFLYFIQSKTPALGQVMLGACYSALGLCFGAAGLLLFFTSFFTNHDYTFHNANLLFCNPILLVTVPLGIQYALSENFAKRIFSETSLRVIWLLMLIGVFVSFFIRQENLSAKILILPIALVLSSEPISLKKLLAHIFWRW